MENMQYRNRAAAFKLDGYFLPRPNESPQATFDRAKTELLFYLQRDKDDCEKMSFETFLAETK